MTIADQNYIRLRLADILESIVNEDVSMGELVELQGLADQIDPDDFVLLEAAGVPEHIENDPNTNRHIRAGHAVSVDWNLYGTSDVKPDFTVSMKPEELYDTEGEPTVYCRTCEREDMKWTRDMEWV